MEVASLPATLWAVGFPRLEVLAIAGRLPSQLRVGQQVPLSEAFTIGTEPASSLVLNSPQISPRHLRIELKFDRWWLLDLGSKTGSVHNGARVVNVELRHLDTIGVGEVMFRFELREPVHAVEPAMEAAIVAKPDDLTRWTVYADWLLEQGDPLGERIMRPEAEDDGRWLGVLAPLWHQGLVEVDWFCGLPRKLVLRNPLDELPLREVQQALRPLSTDPNFRFVQTLELDLESLVGTSTADAYLRAVLEPLRTASLPMLRSLRVEPVEGAPNEAARAVLHEAGAQLGAKVNFVPWPNPVGVEVLTAPRSVSVSPPVGTWVPLSPVDANVIGKLDGCVVSLSADEGHPALETAVRLERDGAWYAENLLHPTHWRSEFAMRLNGRPTVRARLRPGDVLEVAAGLLVRFGPKP